MNVRPRQAKVMLKSGLNYDREADLVFANELGGLLDPRYAHALPAAEAEAVAVLDAVLGG